MGNLKKIHMEDSSTHETPYVLSSKVKQYNTST